MTKIKWPTPILCQLYTFNLRAGLVQWLDKTAYVLFIWCICSFDEKYEKPFMACAYSVHLFSFVTFFSVWLGSISVAEEGTSSPKWRYEASQWVCVQRRGPDLPGPITNWYEPSQVGPDMEQKKQGKGRVRHGDAGSVDTGSQNECFTVGRVRTEIKLEMGFGSVKMLSLVQGALGPQRDTLSARHKVISVTPTLLRITKVKGVFKSVPSF